MAELNADDAIDGILVQLPLPDSIDESRVIRAVDPVKDVDGFHPVNAGLLLAGTPAHVPARPSACSPCSTSTASGWRGPAPS